uniref:Uncharacterized protein n=1 Tax=Anguilla anguilla TaxID=7936 RepID=A0A0E9SZZ2_ANGAN
MKWMVMQSALRKLFKRIQYGWAFRDPRTSSEKRKLLQRDNLTTGRD